MYSFDKHRIIGAVGPMGTRYSLSPYMTEQNKVQAFAEDRAHQAKVAERETAVKVGLARKARSVGGRYTSGVRRRPARVMVAAA